MQPQTNGGLPWIEQPAVRIGLGEVRAQAFSQGREGLVVGLLLGYLFYRSGLVPRWMAMFGLVGGPLIFASAIAVLFGTYEQGGVHFLFSIPEIVFELSITIYTIAKGFKPSPILDDTRYAGVGEGSGSAAPAAP
jgi:hypothetical protein